MWGVVVCLVMAYLTVCVLVRAWKEHNLSLVIFWGFMTVVWLYLGVVGIYGFWTFGR